MGRKKRPFINKKEAQTFRLVHRSQRDPLQADEESSRYVLQPLQNDGARHLGDEFDEDESTAKEDQIIEQQKYGIFFDDDYDYMQHLRERGQAQLVFEEDGRRTRSSVDMDAYVGPSEKPVQVSDGLQLPSSVFASAQEMPVGMLNKAAPQGLQPGWDPDVMAALHDDDNIPEDSAADGFGDLEDDFVQLANEGASEDEEDEMYKRRIARLGGDHDDSDDEDEWEDIDDDGDNEAVALSTGRRYSNDDLDLDSEIGLGMETQSRFTEYSMTSSVMRRNQGLTLVDARFEKLMEEYDEEKIGALDDDAEQEMDGATGGQVISEVMEQLLAEHEEKKVSAGLAGRPVATEGAASSSQQTALLAQQLINEDEDSDGSSDREEYERITVPVREEWDCVSILSTLSNKHNHPAIIELPSAKSKQKKAVEEGSKDPIQLDANGLPMNVFRQSRPGRGRQKQEREKATVSTQRPKGETTEEKHLRKQTVKEKQRERRAEKKATRTSYKTEQRRQEHLKMTSAPGVRI